MLMEKKNKTWNFSKRQMQAQITNSHIVKLCLRFTHCQTGDSEQIGTRRANNIATNFRTCLAFALMKLNDMNKAQKEHISTNPQGSAWTEEQTPFAPEEC